MMVVFSMMYLRMTKLVMMMLSGPGCWMVSQAFLLWYHYLDNGCNVCGLEFNYNNEEEKKNSEEKKEKEEEEQGKEEEKEKKVEEEKEKKQDKMDEEDKDDSKSILGANKSEHEVFYNNQIFRQLFLGFEVESEEGR